MAGKNKGGREIRKPKQDKKAKPSKNSGVVQEPLQRAAKERPAK
ncbi:MAG: hypothetical protein ABJB98_08170 [Actinomycetota bacterium]